MVVVQSYTETKEKRRSCLGWLGWILLAICTIGLVILIPFLLGNKEVEKRRSEALCRNCGYRWAIK